MFEAIFQFLVIKLGISSFSAFLAALVICVALADVVHGERRSFALHARLHLQFCLFVCFCMPIILIVATCYLAILLWQSGGLDPVVVAAEVRQFHCDFRLLRRQQALHSGLQIETGISD